MTQTAAEKKTEDWMTSKWRPLMAITYMATIWFDFIVGPIVFNILQFYNPGQAVTTWTPLTLQGGGLYHLAMGGILGIAAYTRGKEKIATIEAGEQKSFSGGFEGTPVASPSAQPQWITPSPEVAAQPQQTWAPQPQQTYTQAPAPTASDFGSAPPAFDDISTAAPTPNALVDDPNRPLRRPRK
jgi:hypothetical protein